MTNLPVSGIFRITCEYHKKGNNWSAGHHTGIDFVSLNYSVFGTCNGKVYSVGNDKYYGKYVVVRDSERNYFHWFCHLSIISVSQNQNVDRGTLIGKMGKTGNATGIHLHYEIRKSSNIYNDTINPAEYIGIENKKGLYNSIFFHITEDNKVYNVGEKVKIKVAFTGAERKNESLIQIGTKQLWVYNSCLNINKTQATCIICYVDTFKLMLEIDSVEAENRQFWCEKENIIK